jgi:hypothetical protein
MTVPVPNHRLTHNASRRARHHRAAAHPVQLMPYLGQADCGLRSCGLAALKLVSSSSR